LSKRIETLDRKIGYILARLGVPVKKPFFVKMVKRLLDKGLNVDVKIYNVEGRLVSPTIENIMERLAEKGYVKILYTLDKRGYANLYVEVYSPTEKIKKFLENPKFSKKDKKIIDDYVDEFLSRVKLISKSASQTTS